MNRSHPSGFYDWETKSCIKLIRSWLKKNPNRHFETCWYLLRGSFNLFVNTPLSTYLLKSHHICAYSQIDYLVSERKGTYFLVSPPFVKGDRGGFNGISIYYKIPPGPPLSKGGRFDGFSFRHYLRNSVCFYIKRWSETTH